MNLPAWDEITSSEGWGTLKQSDKSRVMQSYLNDLSKTEDWQSLSGANRFKVIRQMEIDSGLHLEPPKESLGRQAYRFFTGDPNDIKEFEITDEGKAIIRVPETAEMGFFEDPITALSMGVIAGAKAVAGGPLQKALTAGREFLGWQTGGASEIPMLAKAGAKGVVKAIETRPLAKAAQARQAKGVFESITPEAKTTVEKIAAPTKEALVETVPKVAVKQAQEAQKRMVEADVGKQTATLDTGGLEALAKEQAQETQKGMVGIDIGRQKAPPLYQFEPATESLFQEAQGIKPVSFGEKVKSMAVEVAHKFSRDFEHLPNTAQNAELMFVLKRLEKQKDVVADRTVRNIGEVVSGLDASAYDVFRRKVILDDLAGDVERGRYIGKELPFNFKPESLTKARSDLDGLVSVNPKIVEALKKRKIMWDQIKEEYIEALSPYKLGVEDMFNENYYRHQVLAHVNENGIFGTSRRLRPPTNRGYTKERTGYEGLYNTDYLEAEHQIMAQMLHDVEIAKALTKIDAGENIIKQVKQTAKEQGLVNWKEVIPEGYTVWQPKEGNVFYPALTIDEKTAAEIMSGELDDIAQIADAFKNVMAVGGRRKEWVVRNEVADTLNNLVRERAKGLISSVDLKLLNAWKQWQLISPRRYAKYNTRNLTGDAEAAWLGNPSGFAKTGRAVKELGDVYFRKKPMTPDMKAWFERGGMNSTLQAQEMDALKPMWMFSRLYAPSEKTSGLWSKYWRTARLTTDFRESILRYANFLDYKEQLARGGGIPKNYGASKPEVIDALQSIEDKAYWLSNDLLGAYDRVSFAGNIIRERLFPFWSWQEVNFKRYLQLYKNAANDTDLALKIGKKLGVAGLHTSINLGRLAIKGAAFATALQVWNLKMYPELEKKLPADVRKTPHIVLGTDEKGDILYFNRLGTLDDFITWFGLDYAPRFMGDYLNGKMTLKETLKAQAEKTAQAPINKFAQGAMPYGKLFAEMYSRRGLFPDIFKPGTVRDRWQHLAKSFGLENEYALMAGKPSRGYVKSLKDIFIYRLAPGEASYRNTYDRKAEFMQKIGRSADGFWLTDAGDALYNMKLSLRYDDKEAFSKYFAQYVNISSAQVRTPQQIQASMKSMIESMHPLAGLNDVQRKAFISQLDKNGQDDLVQAIQFHQEVLMGTAQKPKEAVK